MSGRRRASETRTALNRAFGPPARPPLPPPPYGETPPVPAEPVEPVQPAAAPSPKVKVVTSKFTANLDADTAAEFDGLALAARRKLGRRVDKLDILKALIRLAADDASLRDQIISEVEKAGQ
jgi:hypothetical protein